MSFTSLPVGGCWPSSGSRHHSEWAWPCCCWGAAHLCTAGLGCHAKREEGTMYFLIEKGGEGGLSTASDMGFTTKTGVDIRSRACLGPAGSVLPLVSRWSVSDITSRGKSHLHLSPQQFFPNMNREWFLRGDLWARNAITYTTVTWDNIYYW